MSDALQIKVPQNGQPVHKKDNDEVNIAITDLLEAFPSSIACIAHVRSMIRQDGKEYHAWMGYQSRTVTMSQLPAAYDSAVEQGFYHARVESCALLERLKAFVEGVDNAIKEIDRREQEEMKRSGGGSEVGPGAGGED